MSPSPIVRKALVLSPIASHPQDYGNRNRVLHTTTFFKEMGYEVNFLLYPFEPDWLQGIPESAKEMRAAWTSFNIIPPSRALHMPALGEHHLIDEWWDPQIGHHLDWWFAREYFDVFIVNYTFLSKAFAHAPRGTVKVLETHDLFSGRKEMFAANGAGPDFFYTTPGEEKIAFDRTDVLIAIKDGEAEILRRMTARDVVSLPFYMPEKPSMPSPGRLTAGHELRVGFLGALNTVNIFNMRRFLERFEKYLQIYVPNMRLDVVGNVCAQLSATSPGVNLLGRVENIEDFYDNVDVVVAPLMFSTGIKIKVGEALSFGKAVVATRNGFDGYAATDPFHALESYDAVCRALVMLAFDRERLQLLESKTAVAAQLARRHNADGYRALAGAVKRHSKVIVFLTDLPVWNVTTTHQERIAQWCQFCGHLSRTVVISVGPQPVEANRRNDLHFIRFIDCGGEHRDINAALEALDELSRSLEIIEIVIATEGELGRSLWELLGRRFAHVTLDTWVPELAAIAAGVSDGTPGDLWMARERHAEDMPAGRSLSTTAFRYEPYALRGWVRRPRTSEILLALCDPDEDDRQGAELVAAAVDGKHVVSILDFEASQDWRSGAGILETLKEQAIPALIVTLGRDFRAVRAFRSLASQAGIDCLHAGADAFPILINDDEGTTCLCSTYAELGRHLAENSPTTTYASLQSSDGGWSTYWRLLSLR